LLGRVFRVGHVVPRTSSRHGCQHHSSFGALLSKHRDFASQHLNRNAYLLSVAEDA
jgi:hypothetical protein